MIMTIVSECKGHMLELLYNERVTLVLILLFYKKNLYTICNVLREIIQFYLKHILPMFNEHIFCNCYL